MNFEHFLGKKVVILEVDRFDRLNSYVGKLISIPDYRSYKDDSYIIIEPPHGGSCVLDQRWIKSVELYPAECAPVYDPSEEEIRAYIDDYVASYIEENCLTRFAQTV